MSFFKLKKKKKKKEAKVREALLDQTAYPQHSNGLFHTACSWKPVSGRRPVRQVATHLTLESSQSVFLCSIPNTSSLETTSSKSHIQLSQPLLAWITHTAISVLPHKSIPTVVPLLLPLSCTLSSICQYFFFFFQGDAEKIEGGKIQFCCNCVLSSSCLEGYWLTLHWTVPVMSPPKICLSKNWPKMLQQKSSQNISISQWKIIKGFCFN